jgi:hypothetical protein
VLRHRSQLSTAIYAKVDTARLRGVARPLARTAVTAMTSEGTATSPGGPCGLRRAAEEYVATRRALEFVLSTQGRFLMDFVPTVINMPSVR